MSKLNNYFKLSFSVVGFQKSGTSTVHNWIVRNTNSIMPDIKETHHFLNRPFDDDYVKFFEDALSDMVYGEADPEYMYSQSAILRLLDHNCNMKFVVIMRDPYDRAYSHFCMQKRRSLVGEDFFSIMKGLQHQFSAESIASNEFYPNQNDFFSRSLYSLYVSRFVKIVPARNIKFILYDDLFDKSKSATVFEEVCDFLNLEVSEDLDLTGSSNIGGEVKSRLVQSVLFEKKSYYRKFFRPFVRILLPMRVRRLIAARIEFWNLSGAPELLKLSGHYGGIIFPDEIVKSFNDDIDELAMLIGDSRVLNWKR